MSSFWPTVKDMLLQSAMISVRPYFKTIAVREFILPSYLFLDNPFPLV